jgi:hypothetical protein
MTFLESYSLENKDLKVEETFKTHNEKIKQLLSDLCTNDKDTDACYQLGFFFYKHDIGTKVISMDKI